MSIGEAAGALGVSVTTLRRWEANGKLIAAYMAGGHRRYDLTKLRPDLYLVPDQLELLDGMRRVAQEKSQTC
ncbi:MerR family transcriptional regulator [Cupriavidus sp. D39]|uniref:MerR family transcriptional regulator n=1 Tax=Cupriavidus sp. D39 TaxID=2997877 RepID=UPI00227115A9|nr:helix-turn-helix domain-containing protein [Cupriavidus sp. D39]MCY0858745.1 helix-turn-helix domain-containing protein [Cupriavidus sp. D39]